MFQVFREPRSSIPENPAKGIQFSEGTYRHPEPAKIGTSRALKLDPVSPRPNPDRAPKYPGLKQFRYNPVYARLTCGRNDGRAKCKTLLRCRQSICCVDKIRELPERNGRSEEHTSELQ